MGLYVVKCSCCNETFQWFSGNPEQVCEVCKKKSKKTSKKEDASTNSLGSVPNGRLIRRDSNKIVAKGESMSLAKKFLGLLFEDDVEGDVPLDGQSSEPGSEVEPEVSPMVVLCDELSQVVSSMDDGEMKDKLTELAVKMKDLCGAAPVVTVEEPSVETEPEEAASVEPVAPLESVVTEAKIYPWTK